MRKIHGVLVFKMPPKKRSTGEEGEKVFNWTDHEIALPVGVIIDYKADRASKGEDWDTMRSKYEDILALFLERYPTDPAKESEFPNSKDKSVFSKERLIGKIKKLKLNFRKAIDSGKRSGGGRVVTNLYDECLEIWSGPPAVDSMPSGLESSVETAYASDSEGNGASVSFTATGNDHKQDGNTSASATVENNSERRKLVSEMIKGRKDSKLTKKLSTENQLLALGREELSLKRKLIEKMDESERKYQKSMETFANSLSSMCATLNSGFAMLGTILQNPNQAQGVQVPPGYIQQTQAFQRASSFIPSDTHMYFEGNNPYTEL